MTTYKFTHGPREPWWECITDVPCPVPGCDHTLVWYEAGYVPGYRVCMPVIGQEDDGRNIYDRDQIRHRFALSPGNHGPGVVVLQED